MKSKNRLLSLVLGGLIALSTLCAPGNANASFLVLWAISGDAEEAAFISFFPGGIGLLGFEPMVKYKCSSGVAHCVGFALAGTGLIALQVAILPLSVLDKKTPSLSNGLENKAAGELLNKYGKLGLDKNSALQISKMVINKASKEVANTTNKKQPIKIKLKEQDVRDVLEFSQLSGKNLELLVQELI